MGFFKKTLKLFWARFWYRSNFLDFYLRIRDKVFNTDHTVVLLYHRIIPKEKEDTVLSLPGIVVYQDSFEEQVKFLSEHYHIVSMDEFIEAKDRQIDLPHKSVVITFDDGWEDNYLYAFPILKKYKVSATIFLTAGLIGTKKFFWPEKVIFLTKKLFDTNGMESFFTRYQAQEFHALLTSLFKDIESSKSWYMFIERFKKIDEQKRDIFIADLETFLQDPEFPSENFCLNWYQVKEMAHFGFDFASHGMSHKILTDLNEKEIRKEVAGSKNNLESELNTTVNSFSYPNGNYNETIIKILKSSGYQSAFTTEPGMNKKECDLYRLRRINIHEGMISDLHSKFSKELFAAYLAGIL
jgi:peptidoglycan/xylan/chitin deacetylase (PgdA/CDA1 family)